MKINGNNASVCDCFLPDNELQFLWELGEALKLFCLAQEVWTRVCKEINPRRIKLLGSVHVGYVFGMLLGES
jgi:hypothetical protein